MHVQLNELPQNPVGRGLSLASLTAEKIKAEGGWVFAQGHAAFWAQGLREQGLHETARTNHSAQHAAHTKPRGTC